MIDLLIQDSIMYIRGGFHFDRALQPGTKHTCLTNRLSAETLVREEVS